MVDKAPIVVESLKDNGGIRSKIEVTLTGGASAPLHFHDQFDETFEIVEGEAAVRNGKTKMKLGAGMSTTAKRSVVHSYKVNSKANKVVVNVILEPGYEGFENVINIMNGLQADGKYGQTSKLTWSNIPLLATINELSNTNLIGFPKFIMKILFGLHGANKIKRAKKECLEKYCKLNINNS